MVNNEFLDIELKYGDLKNISSVAISPGSLLIAKDNNCLNGQIFCDIPDADKESRIKLSGVGYDLSNQRIQGVSIKNGAEIFNDYREYTQSTGDNIGTGNLAVGEYSHAEGKHTKAIGDRAHSEGYGTIADGKQSHAEGYLTIAEGNQSHAEGNEVKAAGKQSHAEGYQTLSCGNQTHAEGHNTIASGLQSHVEGRFGSALGSSSHVEGIGEYIIYDNSLFTDAQRDEMAQAMFDEVEGGYNSLSDSDKEYIDLNIKYFFALADHYAKGKASHTEGYKTRSEGEASHAEGGRTIALGNQSHAEGYLGMAQGRFSHVEGLGECMEGFEGSELEDNEDILNKLAKKFFNKDNYTSLEKEEDLFKICSELFFLSKDRRNHCAMGEASHVEGAFNIAEGNYSHVEGSFNRAVGVSSHAEGAAVQSQGENSHAEGYSTSANGKNSHAEGYAVQSQGENSHAEGRSAHANGENSHAEGQSAHANGKNSHAEGYFTSANGENSHAEGYEAIADGKNSHAEGNNTVSFGSWSHSEGYSGNNIYSWLTDSNNEINKENILNKYQTDKFTLAYGKGSHAEGNSTLAFGNYSHAEGFRTCSMGDYSHTTGSNTIAQGNYQTVIGRYNIEVPSEAEDNNDTGIFIIGNGTSDSKRKNIFRVDKLGNVFGTTFNVPEDADFAEYFEWQDQNLENENRVGLFVTLENNKIKPANLYDTYILGVVSANPAFIGNGSKRSKKEWAPIGLCGQVIVIDDGTCKVNGYCRPYVDGIASSFTIDDIDENIPDFMKEFYLTTKGFRVIERLDETHIKIIIK